MVVITDSSNKSSPTNELIMLNIFLSRSDCIESVLPLIEKAMASGQVCRLQNVSCLGPFERVTQILVAKIEDLLDGVRQGQARPGFQLIGVDDRGITRTLLL
jgi:hypothetical protein